MDLLDSLNPEKKQDARELKTEKTIDLDDLLDSWSNKWNEATIQLTFRERNVLLEMYLVDVLNVPKLDASNFTYGYPYPYSIFINNNKHKINQNGYASFWKNVQKNYPFLVEKEDIGMLSFFQQKSVYTLLNALINTGSTGALEEFAFITNLFKD